MNLNRNKKRIMNLNRIILILICSSGFLLIIYANNFNFNRKTFFTEPLQQHEQTIAKFQDPEEFNTIIKLDKRDYTNELNSNEIYNSTENIFVIYTKENLILKNKFGLFFKSLLKFTTVNLHLHFFCDENSESIESLVQNQIAIYKKKDTVKWTLYDVSL